MKIYLAARFSRQAELVACRELLQNRGVEVTSTWLDQTCDLTDTGPTHCPEEEREQRAYDDYSDIVRCNMLIHFTEEPRTPTRGARHVEMGIALGLGKRVAVVGPKENIFCFFEDVKHFDTFHEFLEAYDAGE